MYAAVIAAAEHGQLAAAHVQRAATLPSDAIGPFNCVLGASAHAVNGEISACAIHHDCRFGAVIIADIVSVQQELDRSAGDAQRLGQRHISGKPHRNVVHLRRLAAECIDEGLDVLRITTEAVQHKGSIDRHIIARHRKGIAAAFVLCQFDPAGVAEAVRRHGIDVGKMRTFRCHSTHLGNRTTVCIL